MGLKADLLGLNLTHAAAQKRLKSKLETTQTALDAERTSHSQAIQNRDTIIADLRMQLDGHKKHRFSGNSASFEVDYIDAAFAKFHRHNEFVLFAALSRMRTITDRNFYPIEIRFDHEVKASVKKIQKLAGFPVVFGAERMEIILPLSSLELPVPTYDLSLRRHLTEYGERLHHDQPDPNPGLRAKIEGILVSSLPGRLVPADEVASSLGMSRRTFARRLKDDGLSFRGIVDDLRCDLAKTYLKGGFSISEISFYLDYTDQAAFSTAFKRWTGSNPSEYRAKQLSSN